MADLTANGKAVPGFLWPPPTSMPDWSTPPAATSPTAISDGARKTAFSGKVMWTDGGTHNIAKVGFRSGSTSTVGAGSTLRLSLQDVDLTAGPPTRPDGNVDQSYTTTSSPATNTWLEWTLGAVRSNVAHGSLLSVVWDWAAYVSGSFTMLCQSLTAEVVDRNQLLTVAHYGGASWVNIGAVPNVVFISDDATPVYGTLWGSIPYLTFNTHTYNNTSDPKVYLCRIELPITMIADGLWCLGDYNADAEIALYNSSGTEVATVAMDVNVGSTGSARTAIGSFSSQQTLDAGVWYVGLKPTSNSNVSGYSMEVNAAEHFNVYPGGSDCTYATISSAGALSAETTTRRFLAGLLVTGVTTAATSGGASPVYTEMA